MDITSAPAANIPAVSQETIIILANQVRTLGEAYTAAFTRWESLRRANVHIVDTTAARAAADGILSAWSAANDALDAVQRIAAEER